MLLAARETGLAPREFIERHAEVFAVFDAATQDSGNVSYGVAEGGDKLFVKTAGSPNDPAPPLSHAGRVSLLRNAVRIAEAAPHPAVAPLRNVVDSPHGPLLVYAWVDGELIGTDEARRADPASAFARFRALPAARRVAAIDAILAVHEMLAAAGWVACDFYDGSLIYDFVQHAVHVIDMDMYRHGPFTNDMGRMFGSTRFMAPEELQLGARIDERTTVFTMGRMVQQFLFPSDHEAAALLDVASHACHVNPSDRYQTMAELSRAWLNARA